ncbi:MAG: 23S rRNA (adenine(2503)-C(2))-methyltransferase RlmN [Fibrobacterota bacterium]
MIPQSIFKNGISDLKKDLENNGFKPFAYSQILSWIFKHSTTDFNSMTNISKELRSYLSETRCLFTTEPVSQLQSEDGTIKFILKTTDGEYIESVLIFDRERTTLCISTQIGCPLRCAFCVTGASGFVRDLECHEIIEQILWAEKIVCRPTNLVFMGMGEPLLNFDGLVGALEIIFSEKALYYGKRKVTVSTCGITDKMLLLEKQFPGIRWAISLHSASDRVRNRLMPVNRRYNLSELVQTMRSIKMKKGMTFTIEYILLKEINTSVKDADLLVSLLHGLRYKVNLIVYNENPFCDFRKPDPDEVILFQKRLTEKGVVAKIRKSKGEDINAACGQLALKQKNPQV